MNILFLILFLIFLLFGLATTIPPIFDKKYKYEECPVENSACGNVVNLVKYVSNCVGIVLCYKGLAKEPGLLYYIKSQQTTDVSLGQNNRICKNCINTGQCKEFENGVKVEWNGFKLYSYKNKQTLELIMDLYGNSYSQNFTETTPLEFFQYFGYGNKQNSQFKQNESPKFSSALIFLDLSFLNDTYNPLREGGRSVYIGLHGSGEECKEETTTVTTPTSTSTTKFLTTEKSTTTKVSLN
ncbi:hypothetical protein Mgra_00007023 [Meloidogyne graminicola]|uniref:Transmembrane protein n=1 Tax=Meloidogyne graminicola TaxID=189291 RepID=A0A8S9ZJJ5_9BILA|nr:hypothetical protein Mgra_00007023 [Meloidogyne graminicola]